MRNRRKLALALALCLAVGNLSGCASRVKITEDMIPTVTDLRQEGQGEADEPEAVAEVFGLSMNTSYMSELTRRDGDNTEAPVAEARDIQVVMKATSVEKDLKIKFVNEKNGKVITGTAFSVDVTGSDKKAKSYTDDDKDGIIHIKEIAGGSYKVSMKGAGEYSSASDITATVKDKIDYKVVDVTDEIKKESEINVAGEDGAYGGGNQDASTTPTTLKDTVEYVESRRDPVYGERVQKKTASGQLVYSKQKTDELGQPMYSKITAESDNFHKDDNKDNTCDRCGKDLTPQHTHSYGEWVVTKEPDCQNAGEKTQTCSCGDVKTEAIPADSAKHTFENGVCKVCKATDPANPPSGGDTSTDGSTTPGGNPENPTAGTIAVFSPARMFPVRMTLVKAAPADPFITYDTNSEPVYDPNSEPVYEEAKPTGYKYSGWHTIDGKTYYYDKNGNFVTGTQVIQGVQYTFNSSGHRSGVIGIDVSKYQKSIDWNKVKNAGINFVMIRCGYRGYGTGVLVEDPMFRSHISGARAAGLRVGVYFFSQAINEAEAVEEASMTIKLVQAVGGVNMPIAIDSEYANGGSGRADKLSKSQRTTVTRAFCNTIANSGYTPMVYASKSWFGSQLNVSSLGSYRIWVAHYAATCGYTGRYDIWQYTSKGKVSGVSGNVDMNISYM